MHMNSSVINRRGLLRTFLLGLLFCVQALPVAWADNTSRPADETLVALLDEFLAGASRNDIATHQRFWSDDLVYTSSSGERFGKADIIKSMQDAGSGAEDGAAMVYGREALLVRVYDDMAVITFRLVGTRQAELPSVATFHNTGVFLLRDGEWRAIAWQATRIPEES
jgi:hypothetical protein